ncbi:glycosyltransferase family 4 protein [Nitrospira moscoviensis]|uniref:Putative Glycosyl transferase, group 1 n=1 Tax=Nitrospira moscoviensis TaxID=42253 RepID=A0A0K2GIW6_NITMO|nr:glycosyltransferase family 4 protein [Nitrospira moscoviensis]ALA60881.1 putative Glycosyl transferase, group 1 [Nitrospira moscoviensis]
MKIAQVAPLWESVPPKLYGGTERVVSYITEELVRQGHEVTLFASGDSHTTADLRPACPHALRLLSGPVNRDAPLILMQEQALGAEAEEFDIIHSHLDFLSFPMSRRCATPVLTTLHGRLDLPELVPIFREYAEMPVVSISDSQRLPLPDANWQGTVYHGLPDLYEFHPNPGSYLAYLGRICPEKRPDHAIEIAKRVGIPLRIAAKVDPVDRDYFETTIEPLLDHPLIEYLGEITDAEKCDFLGEAAAVLCTYDWPEPFGIVLIEALACGTPVLAYRRGSIPEIIEDGVTGFICDNLNDMVAKIDRLPLIQRRRCRESFETRFTVKRMVEDYLAIYERMAAVLARPRRFLNGRSRRSRLSRMNPTGLAIPQAGTA